MQLRRAPRASGGGVRPAAATAVFDITHFTPVIAACLAHQRTWASVGDLVCPCDVDGAFSKSDYRSLVAPPDMHGMAHSGSAVLHHAMLHEVITVLNRMGD